MANIRVTYSGLISLLIGLVSVVTGIIFTLIVTRHLTPHEFGTWTLIGGLLTYVIVTESTISYWTTRQIVRGEEVGKTAVFSSSIFSACAVVVYVIIAYFVSIRQGIDTTIVILGAIMVPVSFLSRTISGINYGWKPQAVSYGTLVIEITKIPAGLALVYIFDLGLTGAILSTTIAYMISIIIQLIYAKDKLRGKIQLNFVKKWIKLSWVTIYPGLSNIIHNLDVLVFSIITGSVIGLAFYSASNTIASLVNQTGGISRALYPKLLENDKREYLKINLTRLFYFAFPFSAISITFTKPALFALNPTYETASAVVILLTIQTFIANLSSTFYSALTGIEKVDVNENSTMKDYLKSKLFSIPTLYIIQGSIYIGILCIGLVLWTKNIPQLDLVTYWAGLALIVQIPFTAYLYKLMKKHFVHVFDHISIIKYLVCTIIVFIPIYFLTNQYLEYETSIFKFLPRLLIFVLLGIGAYLTATYLIDAKTRQLFKAIIGEIKKK